MSLDGVVVVVVGCDLCPLSYSVSLGIFRSLVRPPLLLVSLRPSSRYSAKNSKANLLLRTPIKIDAQSPGSLGGLKDLFLLEGQDGSPS